MLCNPASYYPDKIDEMVFFQDNNLENVDIINAYDHLISQGSYTKASDYIQRQEGIYGFFADFYNLIENRIAALQEHLLQKPPKKQPFLYYDEEEYYPMEDIHIFTDTEEEEDLTVISLFTDDDEQESINRLFMIVTEKGQPPNADGTTIWI